MNLRVIGIIIIIFFGLQSFALIIPASDYNFPITSSNISSLTTVALPYCDLEYAEVQTSIDSPFSDEKSFTFYSSLIAGAQKALIIYSGLGGDAKTSTSQWLACLANQNGYDVYVAPNSFTSKYIKDSSLDGLPGEPSRDALELYEYTYQLLGSANFANKQYRKVFSLGYSHGALLNAHIMSIAQKKGNSLFDSSLLINPPLDLYYGMKTLDHFAANYNVGIGGAISFLRKSTKWRHHHKSDTDLYNFYLGFQDYFKFDDDKSAALIGDSFSMNMSAVIKSALHRYDHPDIPNLPPRKSRAYKAAKHRRDLYISSLGFIDYLEMFIQKYLYTRNIRSVESINSSNSLYPIIEETLRSKNIRLITNADDFLLQKDIDSNWINQTFKERSLIYPYGGHLGNIAYPDNKAELIHWLRTDSFRHETTQSR